MIKAQKTKSGDVWVTVATIVWFAIATAAGILLGA